MSAPVYFKSGKNYLKRYMAGSTSIAAPATLNAWFNYSNSYTVTHNLGYIPQVRVYYEENASNGKVYPAGGRRLATSYPGLTSGSCVFCLFEVTSTTLTITLESGTTQTGNRTIYWVIYLDS